MRSSFIRLAAAIALFSAASAKATEYQFVDLTPPYITNFQGGANVGGGQIIASGTGAATGNESHALVFSQSSGTVTDLNPSGFAGSIGFATNGSDQVGIALLPGGGSIFHAILWHGTAASAVDLNPAGWTASQALGISGNKQFGYAYSSTNANYHAFLWTGTAASAIDLNPPGFTQSMGERISGDQEVGEGFAPGAQNQHALLWHGTSANAIDLHPAGFNASLARDVSGNQEVGTAITSAGVYHAMLWSGTAASAVDLSPVGSKDSEITGTNGTTQAGTAEFGPNFINHAIAWSGTAASAVDLQLFTPGSFTQSSASSIDANGDIIGTATQSDGTMHLVEWIPVPEPTTLLLFVPVMVWTLNRRHSRNRRYACVA